MQIFLRNLFHDGVITNKLIKHKKEHLDKIIEIGCESVRLLFRFFIDDNGSFSGQPGVKPNILEVGNNNDIRNKLKNGKRKIFKNFRKI
ncbi:MAG: hypothetical protein V1910_01625 [bacterium]